MINWTNEQIDTFLASVDFCERGNDLMTELGNYGLSLDEAAERLWRSGYKEEAAWVRSLKTTENYVRANGESFALTDYKLVDPFTSEQFIFSTEAETRIKLLEIARKVTDQYEFSIVESRLLENGDESWTTFNMENPVVIS
jgi:hypothetical protein